MKKTYWWRICLIMLSVVVLLLAYIGPCKYNISRCFWGNYILITRTLFHIFLTILAISPVLFFVSDYTFKMWIKFTIIWFIIGSILVLLAPVSIGGFINFRPTKELVSIWMGILFVIISLVWIIWQKIKEKTDKKRCE